MKQSKINKYVTYLCRILLYKILEFLQYYLINAYVILLHMQCNFMTYSLNLDILNYVYIRKNYLQIKCQWFYT